MPKVELTDTTAEVRKMGMDDFYDDAPQSGAGQFFSPKSRAYRYWIEGWEIAQLEAYCAMMTEKAKWLIEQGKREL